MNRQRITRAERRKAAVQPKVKEEGDEIVIPSKAEPKPLEKVLSKEEAPKKKEDDERHSEEQSEEPAKPTTRGRPWSKNTLNEDDLKWANPYSHKWYYGKKHQAILERQKKRNKDRKQSVSDSTDTAINKPPA